MTSPTDTPREAVQRLLDGTHGVKALEWTDELRDADLRGSATIEAASILGVYQVWGDGSWQNGIKFFIGHGNLQDGKNAAQADYTVRILSALTFDPTAYLKSMDEIERLRDALQAVVDEVRNVASASYIREPVLAKAMATLSTDTGGGKL